MYRGKYFSYSQLSTSNESEFVAAKPSYDAQKFIYNIGYRLPSWAKMI